MAGQRDAFVEHCLELLAPLGPARARRMFGGHGLYLGELFVAIVTGERLFLKADAETAPRFATAGCEPFVYEAKGRTVTLGYRAAPAEALESPSAMAPWARLALQAALRARSAPAGAGRRADSRRPGRGLRRGARKCDAE